MVSRSGINETRCARDARAGIDGVFSAPDKVRLHPAVNDNAV